MKMHFEMSASLKKESTVEDIQTLVNNFQLEDFAHTVQQAIEKRTQIANKYYD